MALRHVPPDEALNRELLEVSRNSDALLQFLRAPNAIPETFPSSQLVEISQSLRDLPQGTAEGCRTPLEYARVRLPAIRREHILSDDQVPSLALPPSEVADAVVEGVREQRFYIVPTQAWLKEGIRRRAEAVINEQNPQVQNPAQRMARMGKQA